MLTVALSAPKVKGTAIRNMRPRHYSILQKNRLWDINNRHHPDVRSERTFAFSYPDGIACADDRA